MADHHIWGKNKLVSKEIFDAFGQHLESGQALMYTAASLIPSGIPAGNSDLDCVIVGASVSAGSPVYVLLGYRASQAASAPHKLDEEFYFPDGQGRWWRQHRKPAIYHHNYNVTQTGLAGLMADNHLPSGTSSFTIDEFRAGSGYMSFGR